MASQAPIPTDPNEGILTMDIDPRMWMSAPVQGKVMILVHNLIDLMANPAFHMMSGLRVQVKQPELLIPQEVVCHVGKRGNYQPEVKGS